MKNKATGKKENKINEKEIIQYIDSIVTAVEDEIGLEKYSYEYSIEEEEKTQKNGLVAMEIDVNDVYKKAHLTIYPLILELFKKEDYAKIFMCVTHEVSHRVTNELLELGVERFTDRKALLNENEKVTEKIAQIIRAKMILKEPEKYNFKLLNNN